MKETLFVSDVHLDAARPNIIELFNNFLSERAAHADALYILGDLFEYWIGDDAPYQHYQSTFDQLKRLTGQGVPVYFLHGNRDFLIAKQFAAITGMTLLSEEQVIEVYQQRILIMHGDTLCTDDIEYQRFRKKTQNKLLRWIVLHLPVSTRESIAQRLRSTSKQAVGEKSADIMDVNQNAVLEAMQRHQVTTLIHGHTHRPAIHEFTSQQKNYRRAVLGDWYQQGNTLCVTPDQIELSFFS
jgi:UDP-2,3-diacylglucosamine hydrolase